MSQQEKIAAEAQEDTSERPESAASQDAAKTSEGVSGELPHAAGTSEGVLDPPQSYRAKMAAKMATRVSQRQEQQQQEE